MSEAPRIDPSTLDPKLIESFVQKGIPHCGALGTRVISVGRDITMALPWREDLVGDPSSGVLHGGAVTSLIDSVCGMAVFAAMQRLKPIATLDLRIDYLKPASAHQELYATAECYKLTKHIAFTRARAYHPATPDDWVASCVGAFMIGSSDKLPLPRGEKAPAP